MPKGELFLERMIAPKEIIYHGKYVKDELEIFIIRFFN